MLKAAMAPHIHIYVAEDSPDDQRLLQHCIETEKIRLVHFFPDGEELLKFCQSHDRVAFILLLDLKMPRVDGFDVLQSLKQTQRLRCNPVIVLSSSQEPTDIRRAYELGANAFVQKPRDLDGYRKIIHCLREFWLEMNKCPAPANSALAAHTGSCQ